MGRVGKFPEGVKELDISTLKPIHSVPRAGVPERHIEDLAKSIREKGFDVTKPASATRLPNGDLIISGGHHRIAAMQSLGESTIPVRIFEAADDPVKAAAMIGIGRTTGKYVTDYVPELTGKQVEFVNRYLQLWRSGNPEQVKNVFNF